MSGRNVRAAWIGPAKATVHTPFGSSPTSSTDGEGQTITRDKGQRKQQERPFASPKSQPPPQLQHHHSNQQAVHPQNHVERTHASSHSSAHTDPRREKMPRLQAIVGKLRSGGFLLKIPYRGSSLPARRWFQIEGNSKRTAVLTWHDPEKSRRRPKSIALSSAQGIVQGHQTPAFLSQIRKRGKHAMPNESLSFSLQLPDRTIDLAAPNRADFEVWLQGLSALIPSAARQPRKQQQQQQRRDAKRASLSAFGSIFEACRRNALPEVRRMMDAGCPADLMEPSSGDTPLIIACRCGYAPLAEACLLFGATNDPHPSFGQTALQTAVSNGKYNCAKLLLQTASASGMDKEIVNHADCYKSAPCTKRVNSER